MGVELIDPKEQLRAQLRTNSGVLPAYPTGPLLERFNALELAQALEHEINRSGEQGHEKIRIDLTLDDCAALSRFLRRGTLLGA